MTSRASSRLLFSLGLALPLGLFGAGLARLLDRPPVSLLPPAPVEEAGPGGRRGRSPTCRCPRRSMPPSAAAGGN